MYLCNDCPRQCNAVRGDSGSGFCRMPEDAMLARAALHFDEEPCISGSRGSGAVFFSGCVLRCPFCQNRTLSHDGFGARVSAARLREIYMELIAQGAHNINLVTPTQFVHAILQTLKDPLPVPVVWNCGGYERIETLKRLEGRVNVYLPDLKYPSDESGRLSAVKDYFTVASQALQEMNRQVGPVVLDSDGMIRSGVIVRHLILPGRVRDSLSVLDWFSDNMPGAYLSLMAQYVPMGAAAHHPTLGRKLTQQEYDVVFDRLIKLGIQDGYVQDLDASDAKYVPAFDLTGVLPKEREGD